MAFDNPLASEIWASKYRFAPAGDGGDAAIVRALLRLAADLRLDVIAEGVETAEQEAFLKEQGCRFAQGYRYARPAPAGRVPWLLQLPDLLPKGDAMHGDSAAA